MESFNEIADYDEFYDNEYDLGLQNQFQDDENDNEPDPNYRQPIDINDLTGTEDDMVPTESSDDIIDNLSIRDPKYIYDNFQKILENASEFSLVESYLKNDIANYFYQQYMIPKIATYDSIIEEISDTSRQKYNRIMYALQSVIEAFKNVYKKSPKKQVLYDIWTNFVNNVGDIDEFMSERSLEYFKDLEYFNNYVMTILIHEKYPNKRDTYIKLKNLAMPYIKYTFFDNLNDKLEYLQKVDFPDIFIFEWSKIYNFVIENKDKVVDIPREIKKVSFPRKSSVKLNYIFDLFSNCTILQNDQVITGLTTPLLISTDTKHFDFPVLKDSYLSLFKKGDHIIFNFSSYLSTCTKLSIHQKYDLNELTSIYNSNMKFISLNIKVSYMYENFRKKYFDERPGLTNQNIIYSDQIYEDFLKEFKLHEKELLTEYENTVNDIRSNIPTYNVVQLEKYDKSIDVSEKDNVLYFKHMMDQDNWNREDVFYFISYDDKYVVLKYMLDDSIYKFDTSSFLKNYNIKYLNNLYQCVSLKDKTDVSKDIIIFIKWVSQYRRYISNLSPIFIKDIDEILNFLYENNINIDALNLNEKIEHIRKIEVSKRGAELGILIKIPIKNMEFLSFKRENFDMVDKPNFNNPELFGYKKLYNLEKPYICRNLNTPFKTIDDAVLHFFEQLKKSVENIVLNEIYIFSTKKIYYQIITYKNPIIKTIKRNNESKELNVIDNNLYSLGPNFIKFTIDDSGNIHNEGPCIQNEQILKNCIYITPISKESDDIICWPSSKYYIISLKLYKIKMYVNDFDEFLKDLVFNYKVMIKYFTLSNKMKNIFGAKINAINSYYNIETEIEPVIETDIETEILEKTVEKVQNEYYKELPKLVVDKNLKKHLMALQQNKMIQKEFEERHEKSEKEVIEAAKKYEKYIEEQVNFYKEPKQTENIIKFVNKLNYEDVIDGLYVKKDEGSNYFQISKNFIKSFNLIRLKPYDMYNIFHIIILNPKYDKTLLLYYKKIINNFGITLYVDYLKEINDKSVNAIEYIKKNIYEFMSFFEFPNRYKYYFGSIIKDLLSKKRLFIEKSKNIFKFDSFTYPIPQYKYEIIEGEIIATKILIAKTLEYDLVNMLTMGLISPWLGSRYFELEEKNMLPIEFVDGDMVTVLSNKYITVKLLDPEYDRVYTIKLGYDSKANTIPQMIPWSKRKYLKEGPSKLVRIYRDTFDIESLYLKTGNELNEIWSWECPENVTKQWNYYLEETKKVLKNSAKKFGTNGYFSYSYLKLSNDLTKDLAAKKSKLNKLSKLLSKSSTISTENIKMKGSKDYYYLSYLFHSMNVEIVDIIKLPSDENVLYQVPAIYEKVPYLVLEKESDVQYKERIDKLTYLRSLNIKNRKFYEEVISSLEQNKNELEENKLNVSSDDDKIVYNMLKDIKQAVKNKNVSKMFDNQMNNISENYVIGVNRRIELINNDILKYKEKLNEINKVIKAIDTSKHNKKEKEIYVLKNPDKIISTININELETAPVYMLDKAQYQVEYSKDGIMILFRSKLKNGKDVKDNNIVYGIKVGIFKEFYPNYISVITNGNDPNDLEFSKVSQFFSKMTNCEISNIKWGSMSEDEVFQVPIIQNGYLYYYETQTIPDIFLADYKGKRIRNITLLKEFNNIKNNLPVAMTEHDESDYIQYSSYYIVVYFKINSKLYGMNLGILNNFYLSSFIKMERAQMRY